MQKFIFISLLFLAASCSRKMIPQTNTVIKDSITEKTVIKYHSDTVNIPGDTIVFEKAIPCPDAKFDTSIHKGRSTVSASLFNGRLQVICKADSLLHIIDSLQTVTQTKERFQVKTLTVIKPVEVIKYRMPKWCWYMLLIVSLYIGSKILIWRYKLPIKL